MLKVTDDRDLAARAAGGDRDAFAQLLERHYDLMFRVAYRYCGSTADAEDIAQNICIGLVAKLARFGGRSSFSTWLYALVLNACRDFSRRRTSAQRLVANYGVLRAMDEADEADSQSRSAWLHTALADLDPALRETVLLVIAEDLSHGEAAKVLGCAETTVSWRMHEAKKRLRARKSEAHE